MTPPVDMAAALSSAVEALGDIMLEMQRRWLLSQAKTDKAREIINGGRPALTDKEIGTRAADAFESGAMTLAAVGHPGAQVFTCNPTEEP